MVVTSRLQELSTLLVLVLCCARPLAVFGAEENDRRTQYTIYASSYRHTDAFNKYAYFAQEMAATSQRYRDRKEDFIVYEPVKSADPMDRKIMPPVPRQRSLDEVMKAKAEALKIMLRPTDYTVVKLGMGMLPVPSWMATAGNAALHLLPEFNDRNPQLARAAQDKAIAIGYDLAQGKDLAGGFVRDAAKEWIGASPDAEFSDSPPVLREKEYRELLKSVKDNEEAIRTIESQWKSAQESLDAAERTEMAEEEYQRQRAEVLAKFELAGYAARVLGDKDLEMAFTTMGFAAERISTLTHNASNMGSAALTAGYVGLALAVADMVSNYGKPDPVTEALAQISAQIETVRKQMHERFDRVDAMLNVIWSGVMGELASLRELIDRNERKQTRELRAIRAAMARHGERLIGLTYELEGSTRRLEASAAQVRRSQAKVLTDRLLRGSSVTVKAGLENINLELSSYLVNELSRPPFSDPLINFSTIHPEQQIAVLTSHFDGQMAADGIDLSRGLQVLLVDRKRLNNQVAPSAVPDPSSWIELAQDYLAVADRRGAEFPQLRSGPVIDALDEVGTEINSGLATLFGDPADIGNSTGKDTVGRLIMDFYSAADRVEKYVRQTQNTFEKAEAGSVQVLGELDDALGAQYSLPGIGTGPIQTCRSKSFCDIVTDHYKNHVCKAKAAKPSEGTNECQPEYCESTAQNVPVNSWKPLPEALLTPNAVGPEYLAAHRLGLVSLRVCWENSNYLPGEEFLGPEEAKQLRGGRIGFRLLVRAEHADLLGEFITARHVLTSCTSCDSGLLEALRSKDPDLVELSDNRLRRKDEFIQGRHAYVWQLPGGARDRFSSELLPEVRAFPAPRLRGRFYSKLSPKERKEEIPKDEVRYMQLFEACFASPAPPDEKTRDECFPKERIDPYAMGPDKLEQFYYGRFWMKNPFLMSPPWRIDYQRQTIKDRIEGKRRDLRAILVAQLREEAIDGNLGALLRALKVARLKVHVGLALGYQQSLVMNDEVRETIYGNRNTSASMPRSEDLLGLLNVNDAEYRQVEKFLSLLNKPSDVVKQRLSGLGAAENFQPLSQLLESVKSLAATSRPSPAAETE